MIIDMTSVIDMTINYSEGPTDCCKATIGGIVGGTLVGVLLLTAMVVTVLVTVVLVCLKSKSKEPQPTGNAVDHL